MTFTALTKLSSKTSAEALGLAMERLAPEPTGIGVFELEDGSGLWEVGGYFTSVPDLTALAVLEAAFGANPFAVSELPETDWISKVKRELKPVEVGRFFIYGTHDSDKIPQDSIPLLIEAAMAFGTGHHSTTIGCLRALERLLANGFKSGRVVDVGCGTAVLAMAAAATWPYPVLASDIDEVAVAVARANVEANNLSHRITCVEAAGFDSHELGKSAPFDLVFANILKEPLIALAPAMSAHMKKNGYAILSGLLIKQVKMVLEYYHENDLHLQHREDIEEWSILTLVKV